jgi:hypothetical protein
MKNIQGIFSNKIASLTYNLGTDFMKMQVPVGL